MQRFSGTVETVAKAAEKISARVIALLPQFTLHDEDHLWNVLRLMEELAGEDTIARMSPLECGIAILAAFTHDLGMALSAEELDTLTDPSAGEADAHATPAAAAWRTYFDGHPLAERIREARAIAAAENRPLTADEAVHLQRGLGQIRSDYVRESHAREEGPTKLNRIEDWLHRIEKSLNLDLNYDGTDLSTHIALLAMSHGQSIFWLAERLTRRNPPLLAREELVRAHRVKGQEVNWLFLSWLLRLADIMDFDASRTPAVLFDHIGIRDCTSMIEWQKHLSISEAPRFGQGPDKATLQYVCECSPHPRIEKAIRDMTGWINEELANVRGEFQRHPPTRGL
ncbi:MAG TPA: hypothetical protein VHM91_04410, partial [Verrucomicrobiales bacterium]|nr:hypothetical protein [Verrucomicrobiales bacterium]